MRGPGEGWKSHERDVGRCFYGLNNFWCGGGSIVFNSNLGGVGEGVIDTQQGVQDVVSQQAVIPTLRLPVENFSWNAINPSPTTRPCSLFWESVAHEGPCPTAAGNCFRVALWLVFLSCTIAVLVSRSLPAVRPSAACSWWARRSPVLPSPELTDAPSAPGSLLPMQRGFICLAYSHL